MTGVAREAAPAGERPLVEHPWAASGGIVWRAVTGLGTLVAMSLVWLLALATIVALPAVTAALLRVTLLAARRRSPSLVPEVAAGIREDWWRATQLGLLVAVVSAILAIDWWVAAAMPDPWGPLSRGALAVLTAWWVLVNVYLWPLVGGTGMSLRAVVRAAVVLSLGEIPSAAAVVGAVALAGLTLAMVPAALILVGPAAAAWIWGRLAWRGLRAHLDPDETA